MSEWSVTLGRSDEPSGAGAASQATEFVVDESLGYLVNRAARLMAHELADALRPTGIGIGQWAILLFLWASDGLSQAQLSRHVAIEPPTLVRTLDRMVRDELVTRVDDPHDGRISRIYLTDRGRNLRDRLVPLAAAVNSEIGMRLTRDEQATLRRLLAKLVATGGGSATGRMSSIRSAHQVRA